MPVVPPSRGRLSPPANLTNRRCPGIVLMLDQHYRRWTDIKATLGQSIVSAREGQSLVNMLQSVRLAGCSFKCCSISVSLFLKPANITLCQRLLFVTLIFAVLSPWGQCTPIVCDAGKTLKQHWLNVSCLLFGLLYALRMRGMVFPFVYFCINHEDQRLFFNLKSSYICLS